MLVESLIFLLENSSLQSMFPIAVRVILLKACLCKADFLVVQQLRFHASTAVDRASVPWSKAKFPWAVWCGQGEKKKKLCVVVGCNCSPLLTLSNYIGYSPNTPSELPPQGLITCWTVSRETLFPDKHVTCYLVFLRLYAKLFQWRGLSWSLCTSGVVNYGPQQSLLSVSFWMVPELRMVRYFLIG